MKTQDIVIKGWLADDGVQKWLTRMIELIVRNHEQGQPLSPIEHRVEQAYNQGDEAILIRLAAATQVMMRLPGELVSVESIVMKPGPKGVEFSAHVKYHPSRNSGRRSR